MWEANKVPPKIPGLFPAITIKDVVGNVGKPRAVVSVVPVRSGCLSTRGALENPRRLWNQAALSCPYTSQLRLCVSFAGSRLSLLLQHGNTLLQGVTTHSWCITLKNPCCCDGTCGLKCEDKTNPTEDTLVPTRGVKMFPKDWASCSSFCYFPWFAFCHSFFPFFCC